MSIYSEKFEDVVEHIADDAISALGAQIKTSDKHSFFQDYDSATRSYVFNTSCEKSPVPETGMSLHMEQIGSHPITLELILGYHCSSCKDDSWLKHPVEKYKKIPMCDFIEKSISTQEFKDFLNKYGIKSKSLEDVYSEDYRAFNLLVTDNERKAQQKQFLFSRIIWNLDKVYAKCFE